MAQSTITVIDIRKAVVTMLDSVTAVNTGVWFPTEPWESARFQFTGPGTTTAWCEVNGSNKITQPTDASHGSLLYPTVTAMGISTTVTDLPRWTKVRCGAGTTTAQITCVAIFRRA